MKPAFTRGNVSWQSLTRAERGPEEEEGGRKEGGRKAGRLPQSAPRLAAAVCGGRPRPRVQAGLSQGSRSPATGLSSSMAQGELRSSLCRTGALSPKTPTRWPFPGHLGRRPSVNRGCLRHSDVTYNEVFVQRGRPGSTPGQNGWHLGPDCVLC